MSQFSLKASRSRVTRKRKGVTGSEIDVTDDLFKRLHALLENVPPEASWTVEMVADELVRSLKLVNRVTGRVTPRFKSSSWPEIMREWADWLAMVETDEIAKERADHRITPSKEQITRMEKAIRWQALYLADHEGPRRVLRVWLQCKVYRSPFDEACKNLGWSRATAYRARDRALFLIAIGLMQDGVMP